MRIDLNADIGESFGAYTIGEDQALFQHITSANIACGFHAGDFNVIKETVKSAKNFGVAIGAHPGYPDLQGFGRRELQMTAREIYNCVVYQIGALKIFCEIHGAPLQHVKPHGALYNAAAEKSEVAEAIAEAVYDSIPEAYLFGLCNSELIHAGQKIGLKTASEAFADRRYTDEGRLCSRLLQDAVLKSFDDILGQVKEIVINGRVRTQSGQLLSLQADTICFHGDGKNAALYTSKIRKLLEDAGVLVRSVGKPI
ncbi:LamB/YcsF family protein [Cytobacillus solani]|uniref:5-oxoprolinase subunit A n=1 Tax=Cytobacillus solani TaxID=1637975 RepID=A0A0Q3VJJ7_9BACI|nr:5-oxoprolinase subunit PxpA [Cytobacillus solani]KOP71937.1 lactam utilization protein LamB [Bacillus sp. FJAT-21945]KQL21403.1 lactam utilization protein LamB [Cytobacillus solani]USK54700.1 LamB/YcsF family protein [Cytobacillus solani]